MIVIKTGSRIALNFRLISREIFNALLLLNMFYLNGVLFDSAVI
jgi:hypothetical protein